MTAALLAIAALLAAAGRSVPPPDADQLLVEQKCGKCHDVSLAYSAELSDKHWRVHMRRMSRVPGAAITDEQERRIHAHLRAVAARR